MEENGSLDVYFFEGLGSDAVTTVVTPRES